MKDMEFDDALMLDYIAEKREFTLKDAVDHYLFRNPTAPDDIPRRIKEYLRQLCSVRILKKPWWSRNYRCVADLSSPI